MNKLHLPLILITFALLLIFIPKDKKQNNQNVSNKISIEEFHSLADKQQMSYLRNLAKDTSIEEARNFLKTAYPNEPSDKHELIHAIGEAAYLQFGYDGLGKCDSLFMFGCYHGVVLEAVRQNGYNEKVLKELADGCLNLSSNKTITTACSHGIGHAIMVLKSYDLLESYKDCDKTFSSEEELFYCWDGVSMENIMRRFEQADAKKFLKADDPYYPCNAVPEKYQAACAREHVFYVFELLNQRDTKKAIDFCMYFTSEKTRFECTSAIGNFLNQAYSDNPQKIIDGCNKLNGDYISYCITRAATQYSFSRQVEKAKLLCNTLAQKSSQETCMGAVEYSSSNLYIDSTLSNILILNYGFCADTKPKPISSVSCASSITPTQ